MITIGIDPSLNSSAMCILHNQDIKLLLEIRPAGKKLPDVPEEIHHLLKIEEYYKREEQDDFSKAMNITDITDIMTDYLDKYIENLLQESPSDEEIRICIEGISYNSKGRAMYDLAGLHYVIAARIIDRGYVFKALPPASVKAKAGSGSYSKEDMIEAFEKKTNIEISGIKRLKADDIADAYFLAQP